MTDQREYWLGEILALENKWRLELNQKAAGLGQPRTSIAILEELRSKIEDAPEEIRAIPIYASVASRLELALEAKSQVAGALSRDSDIYELGTDAIEALASLKSAWVACQEGQIPKQSIAIILKGGGVKGIAFAGAISALEEYFDFHTFVGTSAGGLTALLGAGGYTGKLLEEALNGIDFTRFKDRSSVSGFLSLIRKGGWHSGDYCKTWISSMFKKVYLNHGVVTVAPDRERQEKNDSFPLKNFPKRVILFAASESHAKPLVTFDSRGERAEECATTAARCSMAIPLFFEPKTGLDDQLVIDGGLRCNFPVREFQEVCGADTPFIGLYLEEQPTSYLPTFLTRLLSNLGGGKRGLYGALVAASSTLLNQDEQLLLEKHSSSILRIDPAPIRTTDFGLNLQAKTYLIIRGRVAALRWLREHFEGKSGLPTDSQIAELDEEAETLRSLIQVS